VDVGQLAIDNVQIRSAHSAGFDTNSKLTKPWHWVRPLFQDQRASSSAQYHRLH
jgi:hypothetical protein